MIANDFKLRHLARDPYIVNAAIVGLSLEKERLSKRLIRIDELMDIAAARRTKRAFGESLPAPSEPRRKLSAAVRKRMSIAQRKRWEEFRRQKQKAAKLRRIK